LLLFRQTVDDPCLSIFLYTAAVEFIQQPGEDWFCSAYSAEIPVAVVESEILVADFRQVVPL